MSFDINELLDPLITAAVAGGGLTLAGAKIYIGLVVDELEIIFGINARENRDVINLINSYKYWLSMYLLSIVIIFLFSEATIPLYVIGVLGSILIPYIFFNTAILFLLYILLSIMQFLRNTREPDVIAKMKLKKYNPKIDLKIHKVGVPKKGCPIFLISNSASDYYRLELDLGSNNINSYIIPIDTNGYRLNELAAAEMFTPEAINRSLISYEKMDLQFAEALNYYPSLVLPKDILKLKSFEYELNNYLKNKFKIVICPSLNSDEISIEKWYQENWPKDQRIRRIGNPTINSPIFLTSSSSIEYDRIREVLSSIELSSYIIILDTQNALISEAAARGNIIPLLVRNTINELILSYGDFAKRMRNNPSLIIPYNARDLREEIAANFNYTIDVVMGPEDFNRGTLINLINSI